jgi:hypothetical protein
MALFDYDLPSWLRALLGLVFVCLGLGLLCTGSAFLYFGGALNTAGCCVPLSCNHTEGLLPSATGLTADPLFNMCVLTPTLATQLECPSFLQASVNSYSQLCGMSGQAACSPSIYFANTRIASGVISIIHGLFLTIAGIVAIKSACEFDSDGPGRFFPFFFGFAYTGVICIANLSVGGYLMGSFPVETANGYSYELAKVQMQRRNSRGSYIYAIFQSIPQSGSTATCPFQGEASYRIQHITAGVEQALTVLTVLMSLAGGHLALILIWWTSVILQCCGCTAWVGRKLSMTGSANNRRWNPEANYRQEETVSNNVTTNSDPLEKNVYTESLY